MEKITEVALYKPRKSRKALKRPALKKKKRRSSPSISVLKKRLDAIFSLYVRSKWPPVCFTCGKVSEIKKLQCGHFVPRIYLATRWDESNCRPQCAGCNIWGRGQLLDFEEHLVKEIGAEAVSQLKTKRNELWKLPPDWYLEQISRYQQLLKELSKNVPL